MPGRLYLSTNGGTSWTEVQPAGNSDQSWQSVAISPDGQTIVVAAYGARIYRSINRGSSWSEVQPIGNANGDWISIGMSDDGQKVLATAFQGRMYLSSNGGTNWAETQPAGNNALGWYTSAVSGNGQVLLAGILGGRLYMSTNGGSSWGEVQPAGNLIKEWRAMTTSYDGMTSFAMTDNESVIYRSTNRGASWTTIQLPGSTVPAMTSITMSQNMQRVFATGENKNLYLSYDTGNTWEILSQVSTADFGWQAGAISKDGTYLYGGEWIGRVYRGIISADATVATTISPAMPPGCGDAVPAGTPDLFQIDRKGTTTKLFFSPVQGTDHYHVMYGYQAGDERFSALSQQSGGNSGVQSVSIGDLDPHVSYWFKVVPVNGCATGNWSNWLDAKIGSKVSSYRYQ